MRPFHLNLAAIGLVAVCSAIIVQQFRREDSGRIDVPVSKGIPPAAKAEKTTALLPTHQTSMASGRASSSPARSSEPGIHGVRNVSEKPGNSPLAPDSASPALAGNEGSNSGQSTRSTDSNPQDRAIQLGENVRLPAAILALNEPDEDAGIITPALTDATREIENNFYRELASKATENQAGAESGQTGIAAEDDPNTVIMSDHDVYDARERADAVYRTLYGDEAANRRGISSAIEVQLPTGAGHP
jgi:hypothetical protein